MHTRTTYAIHDPCYKCNEYDSRSSDLTILESGVGPTAVYVRPMHRAQYQPTSPTHAYLYTLFSTFRVLQTLAASFQAAAKHEQEFRVWRRWVMTGGQTTSTGAGREGRGRSQEPRISGVAIHEVW